MAEYKHKRYNTMISFPSNSNFTYEDFQPAPYENYHVDVVAVLDSVKSLFSNYFNLVDALPLSVKNNVPHRNAPETLRAQHIIYLVVDAVDENGEPGCYWCQFIFQFAHEFCHYMIPKDIIPIMRWFEEVICELASHFFLLKSAEHWCVAPPYPNWKDYSDQITNYELNRKTQVIPFHIKDLWNPNSNILSSLQIAPEQRSINNYLSVKLLPYFIEQPSLWKIVQHMAAFQPEYTFVENIKRLQLLSGEPISDIMLRLS